MKKLISCLLLSLWYSTVFAESSNILATNKLYIPDGFDTNDIVEFSISGTLPDTCHRVPSYNVNLSGNEILITADINYVSLPDGCRKMAIPFLKTLTVGFLKHGHYSVKFRDQKLNLEIKEAQGSLQDDYLYGNVSSILEDPDSRILKLVGTNPINCLVFDKLESEIQDSVIVLKPKFIEQGICLDKPTAFSIDFEVPFLDHNPRGMLIHVRVMGGRSISHLFQNKNL